MAGMLYLVPTPIGNLGDISIRCRETLEQADFIAAASLYALAALSEVGDVDSVDQLTLGDVTVKRRNGGAAASCLRNQAELMFSPYLKDRFSFMGV